ncbi:MAG: DNA primase [Dehalococcoidia bacterium]|jgi:DNA primase
MGNIDDIKDKIDIVDLVSSYVTLQKSGRNFRALCPFHSEKTPSFFVFPEKGTWHCFGSCGIGGDIFSFVMKKEGLDFGAAMKLLADRAGVRLEPKAKEQAKEQGLDRLYEINEAAAAYYHDILMNGKAGEPVRHYLNKRGIAQGAIEEFRLGLSTESWDGLSRHLAAQGYKIGEMLKAGLVAAKDDGGHRDLFHKRLMIPIRNQAGRVAGFGARVLDGGQPKYLNSPQTPVFDKSGLLYGLDMAGQAVKDADLVIIVEGYMDVIAAHQHGSRNVVAPMGTSLTARHIDLIKKLTKNIALALDSDAAGEQATLRGLDIARHALSRTVDHRERGWLDGETKVEGGLKVILMPPGKDPDEVIRDQPAEWQRLVAGAMPVMDYLFEAALSKFDPGTDGGRSAIIDRLLPRVIEISDIAEKEIYFRKLGKLCGVAEKTLLAKAAQIQPTKREKGVRHPAVPNLSFSRYPLEEYCLSLLLQQPELREGALALSPEHFEGTENREIFIAWINNPDIAKIRGGIDVSLHEYLEKLLTRVLPPAKEKDLEIALADCIRRLWEQRLRDLKSKEAILISEMESEGDKNIIKEQVEALLQRSLEPTTQLKDVFEKAKRGGLGIRK